MSWYQHWCHVSSVVSCVWDLTLTITGLYVTSPHDCWLSSASELVIPSHTGSFHRDVDTLGHFIMTLTHWVILWPCYTCHLVMSHLRHFCVTSSHRHFITGLSFVTLVLFLHDIVTLPFNCDVATCHFIITLWHCHFIVTLSLHCDTVTSLWHCHFIVTLSLHCDTVTSLWHCQLVCMQVSCVGSVGLSVSISAVQIVFF